MKDTLPPATRLATVLVVSGCIHLIGLALLARPRTIDLDPAPRAAPLALRLTPARRPPAAAIPPSAPLPAPVASPAAAARLAQRPRAAAAPAPARLAADNLTSPSPSAATGADGFVAYPPGLPSPPAYTMRWPAANTLFYEVRRDAGPDGPLLGQSTLDVAFGPEGYSVQLDGGVGASADWDAEHTTRSEGARLDDGFAPLRAVSGRHGLSESSVRLNRAHDPQAGPGDGSGAVIVLDRASMLLQLIGMGLQDATQFESPVQLAVAGASGAAMATFELAGIEKLSAPLGIYETWHLVQTAGPDAQRIEVWLAPELGWYPLQLKTTAADGGVFVQRLARAGQALAPAP